MKRVFIIHGWEGHPENNWFPWLKKELESRGFEVIVPAMPETERPKIETWVPYLEKLVGTPNKDTYLIGHSIGCQAILRYLQNLHEGSKIGGAIFVAGWVSLTPIATRTEEEKKVVKPWFETPLYFDKIRKTTKKFVAIFSDNDEFVPLEKNIETYRDKLGAKIIMEKGKGHFSDDDGVKELPIVLNKLLEMSK